MSSSLSHTDVARLIAEPAASTRAQLAGKLGPELDSARLTAAELDLAQDIVRILAKDVEDSVRAALSQSVLSSRHLPRDVALRLATDIETVALPILGQSPVLTDADLVGLVRDGSAARHLAIARRQAVAEPVSDALVTHAGAEAVTALLENPGAAIAEPTLGRAIDRFADSGAVTTAMVRRATLPPAVAERLVTLVSIQLRDHLVQHHALPASTAADIVMHGRERAVIRLSAGAADEALTAMVTQMQAAGRLTPSLVVRSLCTGDIGFFEAVMAALTGVRVENVHILLHDAGPLGLASLYRRSGLPPGLFAAVRAAVDVARETDFNGEAQELERYRARVIARVLTQVPDLDAGDADYLVDRLGDALAA